MAVFLWRAIETGEICCFGNKLSQEMSGHKKDDVILYWYRLRHQVKANALRAAAMDITQAHSLMCSVTTYKCYHLRFFLRSIHLIFLIRTAFAARTNRRSQQQSLNRTEEVTSLFNATSTNGLNRPHCRIADMLGAVTRNIPESVRSTAMLELMS